MIDECYDTSINWIRIIARSAHIYTCKLSAKGKTHSADENKREKRELERASTSGSKYYWNTHTLLTLTAFFITVIGSSLNS